MEELIRVSQDDLERLKVSGNENASPVKDALLDAPVIHCAQLGVVKDDDYEEETAQLEESRRNVVRLLAVPEMKKELEEVEEDDAETVGEAEEDEEEEAEAATSRMEVKEEEASDNEIHAAVAAAGTDELRLRPPSPGSSSFSSTPRRGGLLPHRPSSEADEDEEDDEATEGDDDDRESRASMQANEKSYRTWKKSIHMIIRAAQSHKHASVFLSPVTDDIANGYSQVSV